MSPELALFIVRVAGAVLLLAFFSLVAWFLYRDLRVTRQLMTGRAAELGSLRVVASPNNEALLAKRYELAPVTTLGRNSRNTIVLDDGYVSGEHASLTWRDGQWWLQDLGSRNGTLLNDVVLGEPVVLSFGDIVTIGGIRLRLEPPGIGELEEGEKSGIRDSNP